MSSCCQEAAKPLIHDNVKEYYGKRVRTSDDLMTNCCTVDRDAFSSCVKDALKQIHPEVLSKNYGCGVVYPEAVLGCRVLDLGSGAGLDCFVLSKLVGPDGHVTGIDMTREQLEVARRHIDHHTKVFDYSKPNVEFCEGFIEDLGRAGLGDSSFDIIVSNCVINLSPNKEAVLREAYRVLKTGGEMYFSDIYSNQAVPEVLRENKVLWGECLSGALEWRKLVKMATEIGFPPPVLVSSTLYSCKDPQLINMLDTAGCSGLQFCSATYRLMKIDWKKNTTDLTREEESFVGVKYKGTINGNKCSVKFYYQGSLKVDVPVVMTASVSDLLQNCPRLSPHFHFTPIVSQEDVTSLTPTLEDFIHVDPFQEATKSVELALPKLLPGKDRDGSCCGCDTQPSTAMKQCCN